MLAQLASVNKDLEEEFELLRSEVLQGRPGGIGYLSLELRQSRGLKIWTRNDRKMSSQRSLKISERDITDGGCHGPMQRASVLQDSVTGYETKFAYPTKMTSLTIKIKGGKKTLSDFTARQICIMCFQASPSLRRR